MFLFICYLIVVNKSISAHINKKYIKKKKNFNKRKTMKYNVKYYEALQKEEILDILEELHYKGIEISSPSLQFHNRSLYRAISRAPKNNSTKPFQSIINAREALAKRFEEQNNHEITKQLLSLGPAETKSNLTNEQIQTELETILNRGEPLHVKYIQNNYRYIYTEIYNKRPSEKKNTYESIDDVRKDLAKKFKEENKLEKLEDLNTYRQTSQKSTDKHWNIFLNYIKKCDDIKGIDKSIHSSYTRLIKEIGPLKTLLKKVKEEHQEDEEIIIKINKYLGKNKLNELIKTISRTESEFDYFKNIIELKINFNKANNPKKIENYFFEVLNYREIENYVYKKISRYKNKHEKITPTIKKEIISISKLHSGKEKKEKLDSICDIISNNN